MSIRVGIDEAGRGPLAGPVSVGVVAIGGSFRIPKMVEGVLLADSKKLSENGRELWFSYMQKWQKEGKIRFHVALVSHKEIDAKGISPSIKKGMASGLKKLSVPPTASMFLDGSLTLPELYKKQKTIIKGDELVPIISLASIAAKVTRDRYMCKMAKKHPEYGFEIHKGYGTKKHYEALKKSGMCGIHRKSFLRGI